MPVPGSGEREPLKPARASRSAEWFSARTVTKTGSMSIIGNHYELDPVLVGAMPRRSLVSWCVEERGLASLTGKVTYVKTVALRATAAGLESSRHQIIYIANPRWVARGSCPRWWPPSGASGTSIGLRSSPLRRPVT